MSALLDNPPALVEHFLVSRKSVTSIAFNPTNHKQFAIGSDDGAVTVFNIPQKGARTMKFDKKVLNEVYEIDWSKKNMLAAVGKEKVACIFECKLLNGYNDQFVAHQKSIRSVHFSNSANRIITASDDKSVKMWRISERRPLAIYNGHTNWVRSAKFSPNNKFVATSAEDRVLRIFDATSGELTHSFKDEKGFGNQIAWHKSSEFISVAQENGRVKLYDLRAQKLIQYYRIFDDGVNSLDFHASGNFMVTGCKDGTVKILDLLEGRDIFTLHGHRDSVTSVKFSGDGEHFVTGSKDRHIMIWKSNLTSVDISEDQENEAHEQLCLNEIKHEAGDGNKRESILVDARKSAVYRAEQLES